MAAVTLNIADLVFILKQIKIAEAHSNGAALTEIRLSGAGEVLSDPTLYNSEGQFVGNAQFPLVDTDGNPIVYAKAIPDPKTPYGLRTVDGTYNNIVEGRETWGAADQTMPRLLDPNFIDGGPEAPFVIGGPLQPVTNTDYSVIGSPTFPGSGANGGHTGNVVDSDPRTISNLIVDMSINNPAAILAALVFAGRENPHGDLATLIAAKVTQAEADAAVLAAQSALADANVALGTAVAGFVPSDATTIDAIQDAAAGVTAAEEALAHAETVAADPDLAFQALAAEMGLVIEFGSLVIPNVAPDEGISAPFNAWMTFFGQFFDHGLDLITKGNNGTIFIPLKADDPLVLGADGVAGTSDDLAPHLRFMVLTRATPEVGPDASLNHTNTTTPLVDQNQTYTSHASHQVFLREYHVVDGRPVATGRLLEGVNGGLATWADVKAQARDLLGIQLTDGDALNIPLVYTDPYGEFIRGANGLPQLVTGINPDGTPTGLIGGDLAIPVDTFAVGAARIGHAFLDDISHLANPFNSQTGGLKTRAEDGQVNDTNGNGVIDGAETPLPPNSYDGDLLDRHFITGDGRGNENIGLTAVHHVFHSEHNRQVTVNKLTILQSGDLSFVNEWLVNDITQAQLDSVRSGLTGDMNAYINAATQGGVALEWDGERLFQTARFATEMQYQHLVFEEFARKIQPAIDPFVFNSVTDINPAIFAEFANTVYRFGHSMLTDSMPRMFVDASGVSTTEDNGLIANFLNPVAFDLDGGISHAAAAGAIVRGMTTERGNAIDEFVVGSLRNNLLGLPLDLPAINISRGRDTGIPSLNDAREQLYAATGSSFLKPYESWVEFAANLKNPLSVVNFIAAYGTHSLITGATTLADKRAIAWEMVFGVEADGVTPSDIEGRTAFLNGTGIYAENKGGLDNVDLWIGGLAEQILLFGGMLGSTFNAIFEAQLENLQDGDRFYYLTRTQGQSFLTQLEGNAFSKLIIANTDLSQPGPDGIRGTDDDIIRHHIGVDSFGFYDYVLEVNQQYQTDYNDAAPGVDPQGNDPVLEALGRGKVVRTNPDTIQTFYETYLRFFGGEHVVLGGSVGNDVLIGDLGDDGIWGEAGDDYIEGGQGVDLIMGGPGDDIILDAGDTGDFIKGDSGNDVIANSNGIDILMGGSGKDAIFVGVDDTEVFAGEGDDFVLGGDGVDFLLGNEGDDWLEGGGGFDTLAGDNSQLFFNSAIKGHDVLFAGSEENDFDAESGDDIMVQGESVMRNEGMFGFDWAIFKGMAVDAHADMRIPIFTTEEQDILRNRFDKTEALSGWIHDDTLVGDDRVSTDVAPAATVAANEGVFFNDGLSQAGVDRIDGLRSLLGNLIPDRPSLTATQLEEIIAFDRGNILLGGDGSDNLEGNGGDDVLDGDAWLNVRIRITAPGAENSAANEIATVDSLKHVFTAAENPAWAGKSLFELMVSRTIVPTQLHIVREILDGGQQGDVDIAVFNDIRANYTVLGNPDGTITVGHNVVSNVIDPATGRNLVSDGIDTIRNIEVLRFADGDFTLTPPDLRLNGFDTTRAFDTFTAASYANSNGSEPWTTNWIESGEPAANPATTGEIVINSNALRLGGDANGIQRGVSLAGATSVNLSYSVNEQGLDAGEQVIVRFAPDGVNFVTIDTITGTTNNATRSIPLTGPFTANAAVRFETAGLDANEFVFIDNIAVDITRPAFAPTVDHQTTYTEGAVAVSIASEPAITDDAAEMASARIVLINAAPGDQLVVGGLPAGITGSIDTSIAGRITVDLTGTASIAAYQSAIQAITFQSTSQAPSTDDRIIHVTVNDGLVDGNVATTTVSVVSVNDPPVAVNDRIVTNNLDNVPFTLPDWALLANDTDADGPFLISAVSAGTSLTVTHPAGGPVTVTDIGAAAGGSFTYTINDGQAAATATATVVRDTDALLGGRGILNTGNAGNDIMVGNNAANNIEGALGNDIIFAGGGNDTINWNVSTLLGVDLATDGRDYVNGGDGTLDRFVVNGGASAETFVVYAAGAAMAAGFTELKPGTEIVITRNGVVIAELDDIEEITINTGPGNDSVTAVGNFNPTSLNFNTITINGDAGNDTVDVSDLQSAHRILFRSNGGNDTVIGTLRPQDVIELAPGSDLSGYTLTENGNGTKTFSNGTHSITFAGGVTPQFQSTTEPPATDEVVSGAFEYTPRDLAGLKALVDRQQPAGTDDDLPAGVRDLSGYGNNEANPTWGSADHSFIRITNAHYGEYDEGTGNRAINPVFNGLDPRTISNILGSQEANLPKAGNDANIFFMAMGQYIDHGLDFLGKGGNGTIQIGAAGGGAPGSANPADLTRGTVAGYDANGVPQHINHTSPYVDQNQAYGSNALVGQFLRAGDGQGGLDAHLFSGAPDPSNPAMKLLPTLRELIMEHWNNNTVFQTSTGPVAFQTYFAGLVAADGVINTAMLPDLYSNYMGSGHALLLDQNPFISPLDHYVAGDGRTNENFALTSIHTIWARNHNFHIEGLRAAGFQGSAEELFQAAKMINEAEYQRVVFDEYLETLLGGLRSDGTHGFEAYDPMANAGISHEFAGAVFRFGHSLIGQTMTVLDENGNPTQVQLFDAFLNPSNDPEVFPMDPSGFYLPQPGYAQHGVNAIVGGTLAQPAENVDFNVVNAVRNDLVRINADLFAFNVARGWDLGLGTLNQVRKDLAASTDHYVSEAVGFAGDLSAYASWEDFQARNGLSNAVIEQFKQAYPDLVLAAADIAAFHQVNPDIEVAIQSDGTGLVKGIDRIDLWVGGLAEKHVNGGIVGQTFWVVLHEQFERLQDGDRFYYISRLDNFDFYENFIDSQEFADIVARNTGMTDLPEHLFRTDEIGDDDDAGEQDDDEDQDEDGDDDTSGGGDDADDEDEDDNNDDNDEDDDENENDGDDDDNDDEDSEGDSDEDDGGTVTPPAPGGLRTGTPQSDVLAGTAGDDNIVAFAGEDVIVADDGADTISAGEGNDFIDAEAGRDIVFAGAGDDQVFGGSGADLIFGEAGADHVFGEEGDDFINGGAGDDHIYGGAGNDLFVASMGDGNDSYYGDDSSGGNGTDTLDMSAITADITVHLGSGALSNGYAVSTQSGDDVLWGIENVSTGRGTDIITASDAVNVMNGGAGNDTFIFLTIQAANGDRIAGFEPGDRLDFSRIDANTGGAGDQAFTLISGGAFTAAGQLAVSHETRDDAAFTIVSGNVGGSLEADFHVEIEGHHTLTSDNFKL